ncbi:MAG: hypothetical protein ACPG4U_15065, partial [Pseudomonadales bacterium]
MKKITSNQPLKQQGQAIVLVLLLSVVGVISAIALISTGILTSEKMQLQNAADATAYSVSVLEARDLNYGAYMNRAMVANEVAIGQMVSMYSWAKMLKSEPAYLDKLAKKVGKVPFIGKVVGSAISLTSFYMKGVSGVVNAVVPSFSQAVANQVYNLNKRYGSSQKLMHFATLGFSAKAIASLPHANVVDKLQGDVELSKFGQIALIKHYGSFYG